MKNHIHTKITSHTSFFQRYMTLVLLIMFSSISLVGACTLEFINPEYLCKDKNNVPSSNVPCLRQGLLVNNHDESTLFENYKSELETMYNSHLKYLEEEQEKKKKEEQEKKEQVERKAKETEAENGFHAIKKWYELNKDNKNILQVFGALGNEAPLLDDSDVPREQLDKVLTSLEIFQERCHSLSSVVADIEGSGDWHAKIQVIKMMFLALKKNLEEVDQFLVNNTNKVSEARSAFALIERGDLDFESRKNQDKISEVLLITKNLNLIQLKKNILENRKKLDRAYSTINKKAPDALKLLQAMLLAIEEASTACLSPVGNKKKSWPKRPEKNQQVQQKTVQVVEVVQDVNGKISQIVREEKVKVNEKEVLAPVQAPIVEKVGGKEVLAPVQVPIVEKVSEKEVVAPVQAPVKEFSASNRNNPGVTVSHVADSISNTLETTQVVNSFNKAMWFIIGVFGFLLLEQIGILKVVFGQFCV